MRSASSSRMHGVFGGIIGHLELEELAQLVADDHGGRGHAADGGVQRDVRLHGDGVEHLALDRRGDALLGLHRRLQAVRPAAALGHPAAHLVDQLDPVAPDDVVDVAAQQRVRVQGDVDHRELLGVGAVVQVDPAELLLDRGRARRR